MFFNKRKKGNICRVWLYSNTINILKPLAKKSYKDPPVKGLSHLGKIVETAVFLFSVSFCLFVFHALGINRYIQIFPLKLRNTYF